MLQILKNRKHIILNSVFFYKFLTVDCPLDTLCQDLKPSQLQGKVGRKELSMKSSGIAAKML